ncbi:MAG: HD domain-containing protein [Actinobacteria bacterium]|nr:HD domain-containing protein [Actinomycetota bacterium]
MENQEEELVPARRRARKARGRKARRSPKPVFEEEGVPQEEAPPVNAEPTGEPEGEDQGGVELPAGESVPVEPSGEDELGIPTRRVRRPSRGRRTPGRAPRAGFPVAIVLIITAALATVIIAAFNTRVGSIDYSNLVFFLVVFTVAAHFDLKIKGGGKISLGLAPLLAALITIPGVEVIWLFLLGTAITLVTRMLGEWDKDEFLGLLIDLTGVGVMVLAYHLLVKVLPDKPVLLGSYTPYMLGAVAVAAGVFFIFYAAREAYILSQEGYLPAAVYFKSVLRKSLVPFLIVGFIGVLMGLVFIGIGMWSMLIALPLLLVFMHAYNKVAETDQDLLETIRVLAAIPEETGMIPRGHADRVARLSMAVARELGLSPEDAQQVQCAAYLHDIGAITMTAESDADQKQLLEVESVAAGGVDIVGKVDYLEVAAEILRGREGLSDRVVDVNKRRAASTGAGILSAVDDFESLLRGGEGEEPLSEQEALTEMNLERGVQYDSKVLRAITRVLPRLDREGLSTGAEGSSEGPPLWGGQEDKGA